VLITGREADDVLPLLNVYPPPEVCGLHGLQRMKPNGASEMACLDERVVQALIDADRWLVEQQLRDAAEFKPGSIAVHWRGRREDDAREIRRRVLRGWKLIAERSGADLLEFDGGIEIRTPDPDKGDAVRTILSEMDPQAPAAYLGDDLMDERGFAALDMRGLSVLVRPELRPTSADLWLRPPDELLQFLRLWLHKLQSQVPQETEKGSQVLNP
jgi:trehalose-phosphatase